MRSLLSIAVFLHLVSCQTPSSEQRNTLSETDGTWLGRHLQTQVFGAGENSEVVKISPDGQWGLLIASKSRKLTLLRIADEEVTVERTATLFVDDPSDSELTHVDFHPGGDYAAITRTLPIHDAGELVDCQGSLVFVDVRDSDRFGEVLSEIAVGSMPDAVDISADGRFAVTADEVDYNDGKCPLPAVLPSVTILTLGAGEAPGAEVVATIPLDVVGDGVRREPEQVAFASDNDTVAVTLQDTHELLVFSVAEVLSLNTDIVEVTRSALTISRLPNRSSGAEPWPDGLTAFQDTTGTDYFVTAGEYNDTFTIFDLEGAMIRHVEIMPQEMPSDLPRNIESWSHAPFRPDSVSAFQYDGHPYLAFSLKHAGAVGVWSVADLSDIHLVSVVKVGRDDGGTSVTESTIGTEGISAHSGGLILTANEDESSVSVVGPLVP